MSGTMRLRQLFIASRCLQHNAAAAVAPLRGTLHLQYGAQHDPIRRTAGRRFLSAQAAPAAAEPSRGAPARDGAGGGQQNHRQRRPLQSAFGRVRSAEERSGRPHYTMNLEGALAKIDVDVKRSGRVAAHDLTAVLSQVKELAKIPSPAALLLIRCCGALLPELKPTDRIKMTDDLWSTLEKSCERLDISHYNALLKVHLENLHKFDPSAFLIAMEQKGLQPNRVTYQRMAAYYCQQGDIEGATKILEFMRAKDLPINETVFNVLIQGYARANDLESAQGVLEMMRSSQVEPSADTYCTLAEAYAEKGDIEKVRKVLADAEEHSVTLSDPDYFEIVQALALHGHSEHITEILAKLRKAPGFFHDALNAALRLVDAGQPDIAYQILANLNLPRELNERSGFGILLQRKLVRYGEPIERIWHFAMDLREKQLNPWAVEKTLEVILNAGRMDYAKEFLVKMAHAGIDVRPQYFWPIVAASARQGDVKGILDAVATMVDDCHVAVTLETLTGFVLPGLKGMTTAQIIGQFKTRFPTVSIVNPLAVFLLESGNIKETSKLFQEHDIIFNPTITSKPLALAYQQSRDFPALEAFLKHLYKQHAQQASVYDVSGQFLLNAVQLFRDVDSDALVELMSKMVGSGLKISNAAANSIDMRFGGQTPPQIGALLSRLIGADGNMRFEDEEFGKHPRNMNLDELEAHLQELKSKNMNTRGVLRHLLMQHARQRNVERAEAIKAELDKGRFEYSGAMYAQLLEMYSAVGDVEKALAVQKDAETVDPNFIIDPYKMINLAGLMVTKGRLDEAVAMLESYAKKTNRPFAFESVERNIFRALNAAAESGKPEAVQRLWDAISLLGQIEPTSLICGPLVRVHVIKNDLPGAMKAFNDAFEKYKVTPLKSELIRRLIETEDTTSLQTVIDASIQLYGETNSLYDLAFAFIECGRTKQAQKIFETPGMRARQDRLDWFAERVTSAEQLEALLTATRDVFDVDRDALYHHLIRLYGKLGDPARALAVWTNMQEENLPASPSTLRSLAAILEEHKQEVPFAVPEEVARQPARERRENPQEGALLNFIREDNPDAALEEKRKIDATEQRLSVHAYSYLIESLLQKDRVKEAINITREMFEKQEHPYPPVTSFLFSKLSRSGDVETVEELFRQFPEKARGYIMMDKFLFSAYVSANRSEEILAKYEEDPQLLIPIGGLVYLLRTAPNLVPRVEQLAERAAVSGGDTRPAVALWSYLFGERRFEESRRLLERHPQISTRLRVSTICTKAHEANDVELLRNLIDTLREHSRPNVALAYSYMIGLHCHNHDYAAALDVVKEVQNVAGLGLHELRLTSLRVLEKGLQQTGQPVPFEIPEVERRQQQEPSAQQQPDNLNEDSARGRRPPRRQRH
ncbi:Leucine-rich PPR motif-containing protein, mitochondrial [Hypsibius exemplaris]|uniref:Leucine-rich PPR motif-containing protein, mitochondrial n=1 Tax=Hypsibius exemplaris TaxID=2072580 RepID=A0A1W0WGU6_HYPEX|nr:Leucine-rich PPR motif-containing protein, mitochondrial [Hypsibius exemplaris]